MAKPEKPVPASQRADFKWKKGQSGNPAGRPLGSRTKLSETFLKAMTEDFEEHGAEAIAACRAAKPDVYVRVFASILPRVLDLRNSNYDDLSDEEILARLERVHALYGRGGSVAGGVGAPEGEASESIVRH